MGLLLPDARSLPEPKSKRVGVKGLLLVQLVAVLTSGAIKWTGDAIARSGARSAAGLST